MKQQQDDWKANFTEYIRQYLIDNFNYDGSTSGEDVYNFYNKIEQYQRKGIWANISSKLKVDSQKLKDYYHNTWEKQFFDRIEQHKDGIFQMLQKIQLTSDGDQNRQIKQAIQQYSNLTNARIHIHTAQVYIIGILKRKSQNPVTKELLNIVNCWKELGL